MSIARQIASSDVLPISSQPGYVAENWYIPTTTTTYMGNGGAPGNGSIRLFAGYIHRTVTLNSLGARVVVTAAGNVQAAIYANDPATTRPTGSALASTASLSTASTANVNATVSVQLTAGLYWFATNCDNATATFISLPANTTFQSGIIGSATASDVIGSAGGGICGLSVAQAFGTWPSLTAASFSVISNSNTVPIVQFKVASVP